MWREFCILHHNGSGVLPQHTQGREAILAVQKQFWLRALRVIKLVHFPPEIYEELPLSLVGTFESHGFVRVDTCAVFLSLIKHLCQNAALVLTAHRAL